jgi:DNA polymerase
MDTFLDFETRSRLNVKEVGSVKYARHASTDIMCLAWATRESEIRILDADGVRNHKHTALVALAEDPDVLFHAHNAGFEYAIWTEIMVKRYGYPPIPIQRWRCTAAKAASMSLPRDLKGLGYALDLPIKKDESGNRVMQELSKPRKGGNFYEYDDVPKKFEILYEYCIQDVAVERCADARLPDLNKREQELWFIDQIINYRGIQIDKEAVEQTIRFIDATKEQLEKDFKKITRGYVESPSQVKLFREWLKANGVDLPDLQADTVDKQLRRMKEAGLKDTPTYTTLKIRREVSKTSTAKYPKMIKRACDTDDRLHDEFLYYGGITGRWSGRGVQLQNMPRGGINSDLAIDFILERDYDLFDNCYDDLMDVYSACVRGMLVPKPGHEFYVCDFASIEARVVAWLAGQQDALDVFISGEDIYCTEASGIFGRKIGKKDYERQIGKVSILALGYNGGINAFGSMARNYKVDISPAYSILWPSATEDEKERARKAYAAYLKRGEKTVGFDPLDRASGYAADITKQRFRKKNTKIQQYWWDIEEAAIKAVITGQKQIVGGNGRPLITYGTIAACPKDCQKEEHVKHGHDLHLLCKLPSGNCLVYPFARVSRKETDWGTVKNTLSYKTQNEKNYQYDRTWTYGGKLVENITQAVSRDLLAEDLIRTHEAGFNLIMHCHDEKVAEEPIGWNKLEEFKALSLILPEWAAGLPMDASAWSGVRYKK